MTNEDIDQGQTTLHDALSAEELLKFYKERIEAFESEREQLLVRIDALAVDQKELHRLQWENKQRAGEIWELQQSLSAANEQLFNERSRLLKLQADNDDHQLREEENQKKIDYLLSLTKPTGQEIAYLKNAKPQSLALPSNSVKATSVGGCTLRTVYLPSANVESLLLKVEALQTQLIEQKQFSAERVEALLRDKRLTEDLVTRHRLHFEQQIEMAGQKVQKLEEMLRNCTRDYILARRTMQENEERAITAETALRQTKKESATKIAQLRERATTELHRIQKSTQQAIDDYLIRFQETIQSKQENLRSMETEFEASRLQSESRIGELESRVAKLTTTNRQLETRRSQDIEGFVSEVSQLRKKVEIVDRRLHQMRLVDRLGEDDRLDRMLQEIENKMPNLQTDEGDYYLNLCSSNTDLVNEVEKIRSSIYEIEDKIKNKRHSVITSI